MADQIMQAVMKNTNKEITWHHLKNKKLPFTTHKAYMLGQQIVGLSNLKGDSQIKKEDSDEEVEPNPG